jgi:hypothetical protein
VAIRPAMFTFLFLKRRTLQKIGRDTDGNGRRKHAGQWCVQIFSPLRENYRHCSAIKPCKFLRLFGTSP